MEEKQYLIPASVVQEIVNHLQSRPFGEVVNLMSRLVPVINAQTEQPPAAQVAPQEPEAPQPEPDEAPVKRGRGRKAKLEVLDGQGN